MPEYSKVMQPYEEANPARKRIAASTITERGRQILRLENCKVWCAITSLQTLAIDLNWLSASRSRRLFLTTKDCWTHRAHYPRGLQAVTATGTGILATNPGTLAALPLFSPRAMGEVSRVAGMTRGQLDRAFDALPKRDNLSPQQQQLLDMIPDFPQVQTPLQASRLGGVIMNEDPSDKWLLKSSEGWWCCVMSNAF